MPEESYSYIGHQGVSQSLSWRNWTFSAADIQAEHGIADLGNQCATRSMPQCEVLLETTEERGDDDIDNVFLSHCSAMSIARYYMLMSSTKQRVLDKVRSAWQGIVEHREPMNRSKWMSILMGILNAKIDGGDLTDIIAWEHRLDIVEKQTRYSNPDFIKKCMSTNSILINNVLNKGFIYLRDHVGMHTDRLDIFEKMSAEIIDVSPVEMTCEDVTETASSSAIGIDALENGKQNERLGRNIERPYCRTGTHRKASDRQSKTDLEREKSDGRPATASRSVYTIEELHGSSSVNVPVTTLSDEESDESPRRGLALDVASRTEVQSVDELIVLDFGDDGNACAQTCDQEFDAELSQIVQQFGRRQVICDAGGRAYKVDYEVVSVNMPVTSLDSMVDDGWELHEKKHEQTLKKDGKEIRVVQRSKLYWIEAEKMCSKVIAQKVLYGLDDTNLDDPASGSAPAGFLLEGPPMPARARE